jgi:hypothetical protein
MNGGSVVGRVIIGTDPHKRSATIEVRDQREILLAIGRFGMDTGGYRHLLTRLGSGRLGRGRWKARTAPAGQPLAARLLADGESVVDVPAKLAARIRIFDVGHGRKTDATDAHSITMAVLRTKGLRQLTHDEDLAVLRLLADRREGAVPHPRADMDRLHRLLTELIPGGAPRHLSALQAKALLAGQRPRDPAGAPSPKRRAFHHLNTPIPSPSRIQNTHPLTLIIHPDCGLVCGLRVMGLLVVAGWCRVCGVGMLEARLAGRVAGGSTGPGVLAVRWDGWGWGQSGCGRSLIRVQARAMSVAQGQVRGIFRWRCRPLRVSRAAVCRKR